jgi:hypothetical protein
MPSQNLRVYPYEASYQANLQELRVTSGILARLGMLSTAIIALGDLMEWILNPVVAP